MKSRDCSYLKNRAQHFRPVDNSVYDCKKLWQTKKKTKKSWDGISALASKPKVSGLDISGRNSVYTVVKTFLLYSCDKIFSVEITM